VLRVARVFEATTDHGRARPPVFAGGAA
jgi:hypothetical protein